MMCGFLPAVSVPLTARRRQSDDGTQGRRLAGAVAAEQRDNRAFGDVQRDAVKDVAGAVKSVDAVDDEHDFSLPRRPDRSPEPHRSPALARACLASGPHHS